MASGVCWMNSRLNGPKTERQVSNMSNIIAQLESEGLDKKIPDFSPGDTVVVEVKVKEGDRERVQAYEGIVIARRNRGFNSSFTVRKISHGEGVERVFQTYSPSIGAITVKRRGNVRRAEPYYPPGLYPLVSLEGNAARMKKKGWGGFHPNNLAVGLKPAAHGCANAAGAGRA